MRRGNDGYMLLGVLCLILLLAGLSSLALMANLRLLRANQVRAEALQQRAQQLHAPGRPEE